MRKFVREQYYKSIGEPELARGNCILCFLTPTHESRISLNLPYCTCAIITLYTYISYVRMKRNTIIAVMRLLPVSVTAVLLNNNTRIVNYAIS